MSSLSGVDPRRLGDRVRKTRKDAKLSQTQLAERADLTQTTISYLELGRRKMHIRTLVKLAKALGTTPDVLLGDL